jgi:tetratricopeptide (TPR) repeat protein
MYCGNKILLNQEAAAQEKRQLERYLELCEVAVKAGNHAEVITYCNQILQTDPRNAKAWINKATSTFWLTTGADNRYNEAIQYLNKASEIAPGDDRIATTRKSLAAAQAGWLCHLGLEQFKCYLDLRSLPGRAAQTYLVNAMDYYLSASDYAPDSIPILEAIASVASEMQGTRSTRVQTKISILESLHAKTQAETRLPYLRTELEKAMQHLAALRARKGLFIGGKIKDLEGRIDSLRTTIAESEKKAAYEPPKG